MSRLTHMDDQGRARMVDVSDKPPSTREAVAAGLVRMAPEKYDPNVVQGLLIQVRRDAVGSNRTPLLDSMTVNIAAADIDHLIYRSYNLNAYEMDGACVPCELRDRYGIDRCSVTPPPGATKETGA